MQDPLSPSTLVRFGAFEIDLRSGELRNKGLKIKLQDQPLQVLAMLLARPGEVVTREELQKALCPADTFVDFDRGLNKAINKVREALSDSAVNPSFVETLPRRGYRFIAAVDVGAGLVSSGQRNLPGVPGQATTGDAGAVCEPPRRSRWPLRLAGLLAMLLVSVGAGWFVWRRSWRQTDQPPAERIESLAVLPLQNLSEDRQQDYFADGMTDELITDLGKISALRVISRTSAMQYRDAKKPLPEIARELNVDAVVEGTVLRAGDRVRITAQLIRASPERHLWSESYERDLRDVLGLQGEVARAIAKEVQVKLTPQERTLLTAIHVPNPEAHEAYLKGIYSWNKLSLEGFHTAIELFNQAIEKDPNYAAAYAGLADCYYKLGSWGELPPREAFAKLKEAAEKAVALDSSLGDAHTAMGVAYTYNDWDLNAADRELRRALELSPNSGGAHDWYSFHLLRLGKRDEAFAEMAKARALDPVSKLTNVSVGFFLYFAREDDKAIEQLQLSDSDPGHSGLALVYLQKGRYAEAIQEFELCIMGLDEIDAKEKAAALRQAFKEAGMRGYWKKHLQLLITESKRRYIMPLEVASDYAMLGEKELAFEWLEKAYEDHGDGMPDLGLDRRFDSLHSDPRFRELLHRIGLPL